MHAWDSSTRRADDVTDWTGVAVPELVTLVGDRRQYRQLVVQGPHGV